MAMRMIKWAHQVTVTSDIAEAGRAPMGSDVAIRMAWAAPGAGVVCQAPTQVRRDCTARPTPNATNIPPVNRSQACTTVGFRRNRVTGRVAVIKHPNQMIPSSA